MLREITKNDLVNKSDELHEKQDSKDLSYPLPLIYWPCATLYIVNDNTQYSGVENHGLSFCQNCFTFLLATGME